MGHIQDAHTQARTAITNDSIQQMQTTLSQYYDALASERQRTDSSVKRRNIQNYEGMIRSINNDINRIRSLSQQHGAEQVYKEAQTAAHAATVSPQERKRQRQSASHAASYSAGMTTEQIVQRNPAANSSLQNPTVTQQKRMETGPKVGTTQNPIKGEQPDKSLVSPLLIQNMQSNRGMQGPTQAKYSVTVNDKTRTFNDLETAQKYADRISIDSPVITPIGTLGFIFGQEKPLLQPKKDPNSDNLLYAFGHNLYESLRYSDRVDSGKLSQPEGIQLVNYYASRGLRPIYNIPLLLAGDRTVQPTLSSTAIDTAIVNITHGNKDGIEPIINFIKKDPVGAAIELPAEAALWVTGGKVLGAASKGFSKVSPLLYQSKKVIVEEAPSTIWKGLTWNDKPLIGRQGGQFVKGYDETQVVQKIQQINPNKLGRDGMEIAVGSGVEKELIFSQRTLTKLVDTKTIPPIAKERATEVIKGIDMGMRAPSKVGSFGDAPIKDLTSQQSKYLIESVVKGQKAGRIDTVHGSAALRPQLPKKIQEIGGSAVKLGDIDVHPIGKTLASKAKSADKIIADIAKGFPLEKGQTLKILNRFGSPTSNRAIEISGGTLKEPKKAFEVVLRSTDESGYGINVGDKVVGYRIPTKSVKTKDFGLKTKTADYQLLTNVKQVLSFQKGSQTQFDIFTSSGRTKDIVRTVWNLEGKAIFQGGKEGKALSNQAKKIRGLYHGIEFTDYKPEKIVLSVGSSAAKSKGNKLIPSPTPLTPAIAEPQTIRMESKIENIQSKSNIESLVSKKPMKITMNARSSISTYSMSTTIKTPKFPSALSTKSMQSKISKLGMSKMPSTRPSSTGGSPRSGSTRPRSPTRTPSETPSITSIEPISLTSPLPALGFSTSTGPTPRASSSSSARINIYGSQRAAALVVFPWKHRIDKPRKEPRNHREDFLGSTHQASVTGFRTKEKDIDYGDEKTAKLARDDLLNTKRRSNKTFKNNVKSVWGKRTKIKLR